MGPQKLQIYKLLGIILFFVLSSCGDEPVMNVPSIEVLDGVWECQGFSNRAKAAIGNEAKPGNLVLRRNGVYVVENFPVSEPLRMIEKSGQWRLLDPTMTPSGMCSVDLGDIFLSLHRRGDKLVLRYPIDVDEGFALEYVKLAE